MGLIKEKIRTKKCDVCGEDFSYPVGRGTDRKHCSAKCRAIRHKECAERRYKLLAQCSNPDCNSKANRVGAGLCEACYCRKRHNGSYKRNAYKYRYKTGAGYIRLLVPNHPLADSAGNVFEHRKVAFEKYGNGIQRCFWCGCLMMWSETVIDHLNENKADNRPENLMVSCNCCNRARDAMLPFIARLTSESLEMLIAQIFEYRKHNRKTVKQDGGFGNVRKEREA